MKKVFFLTVITMVMLLTQNIAAQVTIGAEIAPDPNALLDFRMSLTDSTSTKGVLMPRVKLASRHSHQPLTHFVKGMIVYNTETAGTNNSQVTPGFYYCDGKEWKRIPFLDEGNWFFLPPASIDVSQNVPNAGNNGEINLYEIYKKNMIDHKTTPYKNPGATPSVAINVHQPTDLDYYVTDFDATVFQILEISNEGVMKYTVDASKVTNQTFINIVLRVK